MKKKRDSKVSEIVRDISDKVVLYATNYSDTTYPYKIPICRPELDFFADNMSYILGGIQANFPDVKVKFAMTLYEQGGLYDSMNILDENVRLLLTNPEFGHIIIDWSV